jgi:hypothetical protein
VPKDVARAQTWIVAISMGMAAIAVVVFIGSFWLR